MEPFAEYIAAVSLIVFMCGSLNEVFVIGNEPRSFGDEEEAD